LTKAGAQTITATDSSNSAQKHQRRHSRQAASGRGGASGTADQCGGTLNNNLAPEQLVLDQTIFSE
jgi:hypothetical protein